MIKYDYITVLDFEYDQQIQVSDWLTRQFGEEGHKWISYISPRNVYAHVLEFKQANYKAMFDLYMQLLDISVFHSLDEYALEQKAQQTTSTNLFNQWYNGATKSGTP